MSNSYYECIGHSIAAATKELQCDEHITITIKEQQIYIVGGNEHITIATESQYIGLGIHDLLQKLKERRETIEKQ